MIVQQIELKMLAGIIQIYGGAQYALLRDIALIQGGNRLIRPLPVFACFPCVAEPHSAKLFSMVGSDAGTGRNTILVIRY